MALNVKIVPIPAQAQDSAEWAEFVAGLAAASKDAGESVAGEVELSAETLDADLKRGRTAANAAGYTLKTQKSDPDENGNVTVVAWLVDQIKRPRTGKAGK